MSTRRSSRRSAMRSRFSFSALIATTLVLAACGAKHRTRSVQLRQVEPARRAGRRGGRVRCARLRAQRVVRRGRRITAPWLPARPAERRPPSGRALPARLGRHPQRSARRRRVAHGERCRDAHDLATERGAELRPLVVNARRALDMLTPPQGCRRAPTRGRRLLARCADRGDSGGRRSAPPCVGIICGRGSPVPLYWIRRTHADLSFEAGTHDEVVPHAQLVALMRAAPGQPRVRWYDTAHVMNRRAFEDMIDWQAGARPLR